ncbi:MAG: ABC transporter ATP-binding protein [Thermoplasmata archaeon]
MLEVRNVCKKFGKKLVLDNINFNVKDGEYVVILGPTGAGKTTLLRIIAGLEYPTKGEIWKNGRRIDCLEAEERKIAYLSQSYALFPHMTVLENVMFPGIVQGKNIETTKKIAEEYLALTNLLGRKNAFPHELSGGMMQRVALARALASGFDILLFDEPLRALDAKLRNMLRSELKKIAEEFNITVLHVTHDEEEAMEIGDRILVLRRGKIIQQGTPEEIYMRPATPFVANFIGGGNFLVFFVEEKDGKTMKLRDAHGRTLVVSKDYTLRKGERVLVCFRAEHIELAKEQKQNGFLGKVEKIYAVGKFYEIEFVTAHERFLIKLPGTENLPVSEGEMCWAVPEDVLCFSGEHLDITDELEVE